MAGRISSELQPVEELIVWSKIKFGLKPVIAINHITIYKRERELGPQILAVSKQLYANHYFNASLALTAFVTLPGPTSYLVYENRSRADGLEGAFSKLKRSVVEKKAVEGLKGILENSKVTLEAPIFGRESATISASPAGGLGPAVVRRRSSVVMVVGYFGLDCADRTAQLRRQSSSNHGSERMN